MATLREVRKRIKSAQNIQQITKAMKMVAAAKLRKAQERILHARPYADKIREVIADLVTKAEPGRFPLVRENKGVKKEALIIITADKGLCGSFNTNLIKEALNKMKDTPDLNLFFIGKKGMDLLKKFGKEIEKFKFNDRKINWFDVEEMADMASENYINEKYARVEIIYSQFQNSLQQKIVRKQLLPVVFEKEEAAVSNEFIYEPNEDAVLNDLITRYVKTTLFRAVLESQASEHGVRMVSMEMATNNAGDMIRSLTLLANKTRQAAITREIMEIVGGANAIQNG
ncbi:MAG TPA: ATP synthase F1 subunit gamma [bacterium]|nr:ATP synthase F1 subunit gamma [bacterium]